MLNPRPHTKTCPHCGSLVLVDPRRRMVGHEFPECAGYSACALNQVLDPVVSVEVWGTPTLTYHGTVRVAHA